MENAKTINATIEFTDGNVINLELYPEYAPISVANFVGLAKAHFYDGLCFHRVIDGFMIQGGGFTWDERRGLIQKSANSIKGEFKSNGVNNPIKHEKGVISMARTMVKDSASSQLRRRHPAPRRGVCGVRQVRGRSEYQSRGQVRQSQNGQMATVFGYSVQSHCH